MKPTQTQRYNNNTYKYYTLKANENTFPPWYNLYYVNVIEIQFKDV